MTLHIHMTYAGISTCCKNCPSDPHVVFVTSPMLTLFGCDNAHAVQFLYSRKKVFMHAREGFVITFFTIWNMKDAGVQLKVVPKNESIVVNRHSAGNLAAVSTSSSANIKHGVCWRPPAVGVAREGAGDDRRERRRKLQGSAKSVAVAIK